MFWIKQGVDLLTMVYMCKCRRWYVVYVFGEGLEESMYVGAGRAVGGL